MNKDNFNWQYIIPVKNIKFDLDLEKKHIKKYMFINLEFSRVL